MNKELRHKFNLNQWKNTEDVIEWFKGINEKQLCKFVIFEIKDFYPSIKESLLKQSLDFAEKHIKISTEDKAIIKHERKSLLFNKQETWIKVVDYLDVTLNLSDGSYKPFHKPNSEINYIHRESNHPPTIIKQLPLSVESRLSKLSSDENVFIQAPSVYQEALKRAGYNHKI